MCVRARGAGCGWSVAHRRARAKRDEHAQRDAPMEANGLEAAGNDEAAEEEDNLVLEVVLRHALRVRHAQAREEDEWEE